MLRLILKSISILIVPLLVASCVPSPSAVPSTIASPIIPRPTSIPGSGAVEQAARSAFEQFAQVFHIPYKDVSFQTVKNDGTYVTVIITAWFRSTAESDWTEQYASVEVRNVGGRWQATASYINFSDTPAEKQRKEDTQKTLAAAAAATEAARIAAIATAEANRVILQIGEPWRQNDMEVLLRNPSFSPGCSGFLGFEVNIANKSNGELVINIEKFSVSDTGRNYDVWYKRGPADDQCYSSFFRAPMTLSLSAGQITDLAFRVTGYPLPNTLIIVELVARQKMGAGAARWSLRTR